MKQFEPTILELTARLDQLLTLIRETREAVNFHKKIFKKHQKALEIISDRLDKIEDNHA